MVVRGAPAIGVAAAMGMALAARQSSALGREAFRASLQRATKGLFATRPTAVNLRWALDEMERIWGRGDHEPGETAELMERRALEIYEEDLAACRAIGENGAHLLSELTEGRPDLTLLTHCNAGALATAGYGTALGVVRSTFARVPGLRVFVDETRPFLQGARLTAWEFGAGEDPGGTDHRQHGRPLPQPR